MKKLLPVAAVAVWSLFAAPAHAETRTHEGAKVTLDVPSGWKVETDGDSMTINDPKEEVAFFLHVLDVDALDKAVDALDKEVGKSFQNVKWEDEPSEQKINGMDSLILEGTAKIDGKPVDIGVLLVATPAKKILLVLGAVEHDKAKKHDKDVEHFLTSIKPMK